MVENHTTERRRPRGSMLIAIAAVAILVIGGAIVFGVTQMTGSSNDASPEPTASTTEEPTPTQANDAGADADAGDMEDDVQGADESDSGNAQAQGVSPLTKQVLDRPMGGQEAIDALGDDIEVVANRNGKSVEEMKEFLLKNPSAQVSRNGFVSLP